MIFVYTKLVYYNPKFFTIILLTVKVAFPVDDKKCKFEWNKEDGILKVNLPEEKMARLLEIF